MAILFRRRKIEKKQDGGSIPFYADSQLNLAKQASGNPMLLLQKYKEDPKTASNKKSASAPTAIETPDLPGLTSDVMQHMTDIKDLQNKINAGISTDPENYLSSPEGLQATTALNNYTTLGVSRLKNNRDQYNKALTEMKNQNNNYSSNWFFTGGRGFVKNREGTYEWIEPQNLNKKDADGNRLYYKQSYLDAAIVRDTFGTKIKNSDGTYSSLTYDENFIRELSSGISLPKIFNNTNQIYKNVKFDVQKGKNTLPGGKSITGEDLKKRTSEEYTKSNAKGLEQSFSLILASMDDLTRNTLNAHAWETSETQAEASAKINNILKRDLLTRLGIDERDASEELLGNNKDGGASGSGTLAKVGVHVLAFSQLEGNVENYETAINGKNASFKETEHGSKDNKNIITSIRTTEDPYIKNDPTLFNPELKLSANEGLDRLMELSEACLPNGVRLKDVTGLESDEAGTTYALNTHVRFAGDTKFRVATIPVDENNKIIDLESGEFKEIQESIDLLERKKAASYTLQSLYLEGGKDKEFEEKMSELISRRNKLIREKGGVMKKFYLAEIIYDWAHLKGEDDDELSNDEGKIYLRDHARDVTDPKDRTLFQTEFEDALDIDNYSFDLKYLAKTTIMIPARSLQMIHQADGSSSYTDKHDLDISQLNSTNSTERSIIENLNTIMNKQQQELKSAADKQQQQ